VYFRVLLNSVITRENVLLNWSGSSSNSNSDIRSLVEHECKHFLLHMFKIFSTFMITSDVCEFVSKNKTELVARTINVLQP